MNRFVPSTLIGLLAVGTLIGGGAVVAATAPPPDSSVPPSSVSPEAALVPPPDTTSVALPPAPVPLSTTTSLPLFGAQLTIDITTGPGGVLASVAVNPADGYTAIEVRPNEVVFVNAAGTATVEVKARNGGQRIEATAVSLDDLVAGGGAGGWSGDVFGTGTITTVGFSVVKTADGTPDITGITVSDPSAEIGSVERTDEGVRLAIRFVNGGQSRVLSVRVSVGGDDHDDDDDGGARIRVSLSKLKGVAVAAADAAGSHTWSGTLCNGSGASITYVVGEDGSISDVVANPAAESNRLDGDSKADVRFSKDERVRIRVRSNDGQIKVSVDEKFRCDSPDPTLNTPVSTTPDDESGEDEDHGDNRGDGKKRDRGDKPEDATTPSVQEPDTTASAPTASSDSGNRTGGGKRGGDNGDGGKGDHDDD